VEWQSDGAFCFAVFKDRFILNRINWANIQATATTETICWHFLATNQTFSGLQFPLSILIYLD